ncbi:MAG TPA: N-methyl-L-tryptophan oxidase [Candidatus Acidoferrales bacterium]|nr:N-methyl-L-tryptophan oxidase [Candidatus Acidoferrales bacterium]
MRQIYDVIVIGLGAHGSAAAAHLAKRGLRVLGIEQFARGHTLGSSGGLSRIIRLSYFEDPGYVPLLRRAWDLWRALEEESSESLLTQTGGLYLGPPDGELVAGARESATVHDLAHWLLDAPEIRYRYPMFPIDDDWRGLFDVQAGWLAPERCILAHLAVAERHGATLRFDEPVARWERDGDGVKVTTATGSYRAARLVLTAGAWMSRLLPELAERLWVERNVLFWFEPTARREEFSKMPVWIMEDVTRTNGFPAYRDYYGFPLDPAHGLKLAGLHFGDRVDPDTVEREPRAIDEERVRAFLRRRMPDADGERRLAKVCMYTNSPDGDFMIDRLADAPVIYASACSGHGFKFASWIGELLAAMTVDGAEVPAFLRADRLTTRYG